MGRVSADTFFRGKCTRTFPLKVSADTVLGFLDGAILLRRINLFCGLNNLDTRGNIKWKVVNVRSSCKGTFLGKFSNLPRTLVNKLPTCLSVCLEVELGQEKD